MSNDIPFELRIPNKETEEALEEVKNQSSKMTTYDSVEEMLKDLAKEED